MSNRTFVIDTNVLIYNSKSIYSFEDSDVVLPFVVIEEIDNLKTRRDRVGEGARRVGREIEELRKSGKEEGKSLAQGVSLPNGGTFQVWSPNVPVPSPLDSQKADNLIIATCLEVRAARPSDHVTLISKDINVRLKCDSIGLECEDFQDHLQVSELYRGVADTVVVYDAHITTLFAERSLNVSEAFVEAGVAEALETLLPNSYGTLTSSTSSAIVRYNKGHDDNWYATVIRDKDVWGIKGRNAEQKFALDALTDRNIPLVTLTGPAGTGKTICAIAAALEQTDLFPAKGGKTRDKYRRIIISRTMEPFHKDIGFLPGSIEEKIDPWLAPIWDNLEFLFRDAEEGKKTIAMLRESGLIEIRALTHLRGSSINDAFVIIDECVPFDTPIQLETGATRRIGTMFYDWIQGKELPRVRSFNEITHRIEWKNITNMWHKGKRKTVTVHASNRKVESTPEHPFLTSNGWKAAIDLKEGDLLVCSDPNTPQVSLALTNNQLDVVVGSYLGDGSISNHGIGRFRLNVAHGLSQREYSEWKAAWFGSKTRDVLGSGYNPNTPKVFWQSKIFALENEIDCPKRSCPQWILDSLNERSLAIWFMDDGSGSKCDNAATIHTQSFEQEAIDRMIARLNEFGIDAFKRVSRKKRNGVEKEYEYIGLRKDGYIRLSQLIAKWVHPTMAYKLHSDFKHMAGTGLWPNAEPKEYGFVVVKHVIENEEEKHVFDMEIEDNHTFMIPSKRPGATAAIVVHNCQDLNQHEMKTIITRIGVNSKLVLLGDVEQIDNQHLDRMNSGLSVVAELFKDADITAHVTLAKGLRSDIASLAIEKFG